MSDSRLDKIGEKSCLKQCKDCGKFFHFLEGDKWCEECFEAGLHRDMNDHWENYWRQEMEKESKE